MPKVFQFQFADAPEPNWNSMNVNSLLAGGTILSSGQIIDSTGVAVPGLTLSAPNPFHGGGSAGSVVDNTTDWPAGVQENYIYIDYGSASLSLSGLAETFGAGTVSVRGYANRGVADTDRNGSVLVSGVSGSSFSADYTASIAGAQSTREFSGVVEMGVGDVLALEFSLGADSAHAYLNGLVLTYRPEGEVEIGSVDGDNIVSSAQSSVAYAGGGFGAVRGSGKVELTDGVNVVAQTVVDWSDTMVHADIVQGVLKYSDVNTTLSARVTVDGGNSGSLVITLVPPAQVGVVTLMAPLYTGSGSILSSANFTGTPAAGDQVEFPTTDNFTILSNGEVVCDVNSGSFVCRYNDGTGWSAFTVTLGSPAVGDDDCVCRSFGGAQVVIPHDSMDFATEPHALYVGGSGDISVRMSDGDSVIFSGVPVGILPIKVRRVNATGTTATNILALK